MIYIVHNEQQVDLMLFVDDFVQANYPIYLKTIILIKNDVFSLPFVCYL
jgi:hypothetical protein